MQGAILNIKSTLSNVTQSIGTAPHLDPTTKTSLTRLVNQLSTMLERVPPAQTADAEAVAETAKGLVEQATKEKPNKTLVQLSAEGLKTTAAYLAGVLPDITKVATEIARLAIALVGA